VVGEVSFERVVPPAAGAHEVGNITAIYGFGAALLDLDGDLDLDLYIGAIAGQEELSPPCLYLNVSAPGDIAFERHPELCGWDMPGGAAGVGADLDGDGTDELITVGAAHAKLFRLTPDGVEVTNLLDALPDDDPRRDKVISVALPVDLDQDGDLDLLFGILTLDVLQDAPNFALAQRDDGTFEHLTGERYRALESTGSTLAIASLDLDGNGLADILVANDSFNTRGNRGRGVPGQALFGCSPLQSCFLAETTFDDGIFAWGSYMGFGAPHVRGAGEFVYISDLGPNRLLKWDGHSATEHGPEFQVELHDGGEALFSWAVMVDDFDHNGLDDIYVSQGDSGDRPVDNHFSGLHRDILLMQHGDGDFETLTPDSTGLALPSREDARHDTLLYMARGAAKADLDHDGRLDLMTTAMRGVVRFQREVIESPQRCTVVPRTRYAPGQGHGFAWARGPADDMRRWDIQGQTRWGTSPWLLVPTRRGIVRFPSGYQTEFDCGQGAGPVVIEEPEWIEIRNLGDTLEVGIDAPWLDRRPLLIAAARDEDGRVRQLTSQPTEAQTWTLAHGDAREIMLRLGPRWIPRWFPVN
jgi:hypothetical protein